MRSLNLRSLFQPLPVVSFSVDLDFYEMSWPFLWVWWLYQRYLADIRLERHVLVVLFWNKETDIFSWNWYLVLETFFREITSTKMLFVVISRVFYIFVDNFGNSLSVTLLLWQKFRESNVFTKELIWRNFLLVTVNFSFFHTALCGGQKRMTTVRMTKHTELNL